MNKYFDEAIKVDYVGYEEGHYALVSAVVIDSAINGIVYRCNDSYNEQIKALKEFNFIPFKQKSCTGFLQCAF